MHRILAVEPHVPSPEENRANAWLTHEPSRPQLALLGDVSPHP
jgi:hypothetical protein